MSSKTGFDSVPAFDGSNWLSWSARMSQFLMAQKLWAYVSSLITKPALESSAPTTATSCPATAESIKARNDWVTEDSAAIGYIKIKCTESVVAGIPAMHTTLKEVWDGLKEHFDKVSPPLCSKRYVKPSLSGFLVEIPLMRSPSSPLCSLVLSNAASRSLISSKPRS